MNHLRRRFVLAAMLSLFAVLAAVVAGFNLMNYKDLVESTDKTMSMIVDNGGTFPKPNELNKLIKESVSPGGASIQMPPPMTDGEDSKSLPDRERPDGFSMDRFKGFSAEAPYETRYFSVFIKDGQITSLHMDNIATVTEDEARAYATEILEDGDEDGFIGDGYAYRMTDSLIVFLNCEKRLDTFYSSLLTSVIASAAGLLVVFLLVVITSKIIFKPVEESERKQKQFLTDASHELKTPLAIIEANTEVMELENGESKWTTSTKHQIKRLSGLVEQMVALTRLDEREPDGSLITMDLSEIVKDMTETYQAPAEVAGKEIRLTVATDVKLHGNEKNIRQLIGLLLDNAVKYATADTTIEVTLTAKGRRATLIVYNQAEGLKQGDNDVLFERFYRADSSRNSETGGTGIGLSVAKSIVDKAKGKITAYSKDGKSLSITVYLPL
ncbi:MAG: HAMP domain-containing sensor histidine kinase [Eubacterium sp.]|nr:HAMP domain-containing sensor histidine kinase [Eubacterium sp.]